MARQRKIPGFDQEKFSRSHVLCIGAGDIISRIAPTLVRKGLGKMTLLDPDLMEPSNLNRRRFYIEDVGKGKDAGVGLILSGYIKKAPDPPIALDPMST
jgi:molybdopterin/thiamine biosynthesis adenylyltransferase